ncbi:hypothetical protein EfmJHP35_15900 [Enterococcus faecium]|nr:hypothetical protein EfmJHP35_15900 [Enterococcus faecium]
MMSKNNTNGRNQFAMLTIDDLVPQDHLVRKIDAALDFEFIYPIVEATYSDLGRPSIDPVILIKLVFIQYLFGIRSMRQTIKEVDTNVAYRWFLGYSFEEKIPHLLSVFLAIALINAPYIMPEQLERFRFFTLTNYYMQQYIICIWILPTSKLTPINISLRKK